jgi:hypothetical protein
MKPFRRVVESTISISATCVCAGLSLSCGTAGSEAAPLVVREVYAREVPDSFQFSGAAFASNDDLVLWSSNRNYLLLVAAGTIQPIGADVLAKPIAAAFTLDDSEIEVVDAIRNTVVTLSRRGARLRERRFVAHTRVSTATRFRDSWILGGRDENGRFGISTATPVLRSASAERAVFDPGLGDGLPTHLSKAEDELLLTSVNRPFAVQRIDSLGHTLSPLIPAGVDTLRAIRNLTSRGRWVSLPALRVSDGYMQTLSDLASDHRIVVLYDASGSARRYSVLEIPVGFVASQPRRNLLAGARRGNGLELRVSAWSREGDSLSTLRNR